jgi:choline kinase
MKGVILAAGVASRLRPLTDAIPKCLLQVGEKTILQRTLDNLIDNGIEEFVIGTGYREEMIKDYISQNYPSTDILFVYNKIFDTTNNIYSLWLTKDLLQGSDLIIMDSDIIFDRQIIHLLLDQNHDNCLAVKSDHKLGEEEMKVLISADNQIMKISKDINPGKAAGEAIGIAKFSQDFVQFLLEIVDRRISEEKVHDFYEAAFQEAIEKGQKVYSIDVGALRCAEIDTIEDIQHAEEDIIPHLD